VVAVRYEDRSTIENAWMFFADGSAGVDLTEAEQEEFLRIRSGVSLDLKYVNRFRLSPAPPELNYFYYWVCAPADTNRIRRTVRFNDRGSSIDYVTDDATEKAIVNLIARIKARMTTETDETTRLPRNTSQ